MYSMLYIYLLLFQFYVINENAISDSSLKLYSSIGQSPWLLCEINI